MDCIPCLPTFINPIATAVCLIKDRQWHARNGAELGLRNPACTLLVLPLLELLPWINNDLNPKALVYEDFLRERTMTFPFSERRASAAPDGCWEWNVGVTSGQQCTKRMTCINSGDWFRDECWYVYSLIFINTVLCSAFLFALGRKKERKKTDVKEEAKTMPKIEGSNMSLLCKCNLERAWPPHLLWLHRMRWTSPATCSTLTNNLIGEFPHSSVSPCEKPF